MFLLKISKHKNWFDLFLRLVETVIFLPTILGVSRFQNVKKITSNCVRYKVWMLIQITAMHISWLGNFVEKHSAFHTRKLGKITAFYAVQIKMSRKSICHQRSVVSHKLIRFYTERFRDHQLSEGGVFVENNISNRIYLISCNNCCYTGTNKTMKN